MTSEEVKKRGPGLYFYAYIGTVIPIHIDPAWRYCHFGDGRRFPIDGLGGDFYPIAIPTAKELERDERLACRQSLDAAETRGDTAFIEAELAKNQLTAEEIERIEKHHTPIADWPETPADLIAPKGTTTMEEPKRLTADELEFWQQAYFRRMRDHDVHDAAQLADEAVAERAKRASQDDACGEVAEIRERLEESKRVADDMRSKFEGVIAEQAKRLSAYSVSVDDISAQLKKAIDDRDRWKARCMGAEDGSRRIRLLRERDLSVATPIAAEQQLARENEILLEHNANLVKSRNGALANNQEFAAALAKTTEDRDELLRRLALAQDSLAKHLVQIENNSRMAAALPTLRKIVADWIGQENTGNIPEFGQWAAKQPSGVRPMPANDLSAAISAIDPSFKPDVKP